MTRKQFIAKAEAAFKRANPTVDFVSWHHVPKLVTYPTGVKGWHGKFYATAEGHKPRIMIAEGDDSYVMVR